MKLRDHPQMNYRDQVNWPPVWIHMRRTPLQKLTGEVGILIDADWYAETPTRLFLRMKLDEEKYLGALLFSDETFCKQLHRILQRHIGRSIEEIGDLDLSHTL
jgi:hypothetical protein